MTAIQTRTFATALTLATGVSLFTLPASAFEPIDILERYKTVSATQGQKFSYDSVSKTSTGFTVMGATWEIPELAPIKAETLTFDGVTEGSDGTLSIDSITLDAMTAKGKEITVTFDKAMMSGLRLPKEGEARSLEQMAFYRGFEASGGKVMQLGNTVATLGKMNISISEFSSTDPMTFSMSLSDSMVDVSSVPDPKFNQTLQALNYAGKFPVSTSMQGVWDPQSGIIDLKKNDYTIENVGTMSIPAKFGGYTAENVLKMQKQAGAEMSDEDRAAATMEVMSNVELQQLDIAFTDDSVTKRALNMASAQMQQPPEALAAGAPMMVGLGMAQLNMPELTQMVQKAVGQFLQNPGTLRISLAPENGTRLTDMMAGAGNPKALVESLNVKVTAE